MAESQGFEPWVRSSRTHDFQSCAFDHSANSPSDSFIINKISVLVNTHLQNLFQFSVLLLHFGKLLCSQQLVSSRFSAATRPVLSNKKEQGAAFYFDSPTKQKDRISHTKIVPVFRRSQFFRPPPVTAARFSRCKVLHISRQTKKTAEEAL